MKNKAPANATSTVVGLPIDAVNEPNNINHENLMRFQLKPC